MAFNSDTYNANKWSRQAWAALAEARARKLRIDAGAYTTSLDFELSLLNSDVRWARSSLHLSVCYRNLAKQQRRAP